MGKFNVDSLSSVDGFIGAVLVDEESGMALETAGTGLDLEVAAAGTTETVKSKRRVMKQLGLDKDVIEDMLITLTSQYHLIRPLETNQSLFLYLALDRDKSNLAMARRELRSYEKTVDLG